MTVPTRKPANPVERHRQQMQLNRRSASSVRQAFPDISLIRIELTFSGGAYRAPSPQIHLLYPAAYAFFRFVCPCAECDGDFNLTSDVTALMTQRQAGSLPDGISGSGSCRGVYRRDSTCSEHCGIQVSFRIGVELAA